MPVPSASSGTQATMAPGGGRLQLALGLICMMGISSPQYVWPLFTGPFLDRLGTSLPRLQLVFSLLIVLQTFLSPLQGWLSDRFGPRALLSLGALLTGMSWVLAALAHDLTELCLSYGMLGGFGTGIIYVGVIGSVVRWFPRRRGFAAGVVAAGYGLGAILTTFPIAASLASSGLAFTLVLFGLLIGATGLSAAQGMKRPPPEEPLPTFADTAPHHPEVSPARMLRHPLFWLMFLMMTMMSTSGLMVISQIGAFAKDFGVSGASVLGMAAVPLALTLDRLANGLTRPFFGWLSDRIGRETTMAIAFGGEALSMLAWLGFRHNPVWFVLLSGLVFFGWGEIFSLFPATLTDTFGTRHATANYSFLYMAQGVGSILGGPAAALLHHVTQSWIPVFGLMIGLDLGAAGLALFVLKPLRARHLGHSPN